MKTEVTVDGVKLTAEQVKRAWEDLNNPEFKPGDIIRHPTLGIRMVIGGTLSKHVDYHHPMMKKEQMERLCHNTDGQHTFSLTSYSNWKKVNL